MRVEKSELTLQCELDEQQHLDLCDQQLKNVPTMRVSFHPAPFKRLDQLTDDRELRKELLT